MFDSTHKENFNKTRETITPILDTRKLCVWKYSIKKSQGILRQTVLLINYIFYVSYYGW